MIKMPARTENKILEDAYWVLYCRKHGHQWDEIARADEYTQSICKNCLVIAKEMIEPGVEK